MLCLLENYEFYHHLLTSEICGGSARIFSPFDRLFPPQLPGDKAVCSLTCSGIHCSRGALVGTQHSRYPNAILCARQQICQRETQTKVSHNIMVSLKVLRSIIFLWIALSSCNGFHYLELLTNLCHLEVCTKEMHNAEHMKEGLY